MESLQTSPKKKQEKVAVPEDPLKPKAVLPPEGTTCPECGIELTNRKLLERHMNYVHIMDLHTCNFCDLVLKNQKTGSHHLLYLHRKEMGEKPAPIKFMTRITKDIMGLTDYKPTTTNEVKLVKV